jgi:membrane dipeptidase
MDFGLNLIYHLAGGDGIRSVDDVQKLYTAGVRSLQLIYESDNALAHCYKSAEGGLTELGKDVVQWMDKNKMIIDTANMNHQSMVDVYKYTKKPIMNSHTNILSTYQDARNVRDEFLDLIAQSNGII